MKFFLTSVFFFVCTVGSAQTDSVYVSTSPMAYAFHKHRQCEGLSKTTRRIIKVPRKEAAKTHKPCRYCYGWIKRGEDLRKDSVYNAR